MKKVEVGVNSVFIAGVEYVPKQESQKLSVNTDGLPYVIIRTYSAGVHIGYLQSKEYTPSGIVVKLVKTRRVYSWAGAMTLSQLALDGSSKPEKCQITVEIPENELVAIEIMPVTEKSFNSLNSIAEWKI
jgi:hypothetical protein